MDDRNLTAEIVELVNSEAVFTDLLIEEDKPIVAKCPGGWERVDSIPAATREDLAAVLGAIDTDWEAKIQDRSINRPLDLTTWRLRINAYSAYGGARVMMAIRKIPAKPAPLKDTGLPESVRLMLNNPRGLILVNGATGSGKSTSLAAMVDAINETRSAHVITVEDPIEYTFERKKSVFSQREIGVDVPSFFEGVRDAMRQRPDVIVIGEIRDRDTAENAILAAESGALVIGTLHGNNATGAIQKLLGYFSAHERDAKLQALASTLIGVISQVLLPNEERNGWVLASELLFNHKQQCSNLLGDPEKLSLFLSRKEDKLSRSMEDSLVELVSTKRVAIREATQALGSFGQTALLDRLKGGAK